MYVRWIYINICVCTVKTITAMLNDAEVKW